jgi:hypothetical protein
MEKFGKYVGWMCIRKRSRWRWRTPDGNEVRFVGEFANTSAAIDKLVRQLNRGQARLSFCYEAGPCGYGLYRQLREIDQACQVVAPSLIRAAPTIGPDGRANAAALEYPSPSSNEFANGPEAIAHAPSMRLESLERSQHLSPVPA